MTTDEIIDKVGGLSRFQVMILIVTRSPSFTTSWSMLLMSFGAVVPDTWWCVRDSSDPWELNNDTLSHCPSSNDTRSCSYVFSQEKHTIVSEWGLVCEDAGLPRMITSIQMAGVLIGAMAAGQSGDVLGRRKTFLIAMHLQAAYNLVAAFSVSWQMFTVFRFFIGTTIGAIIACNYPYSLEFLGIKARAVSIVTPFWALGNAVLALSCWLRPNWSHQHIIIAALHVPFIVGLYIAPESMRWLAVQGRIDEAEKVVETMARYNRREKPADSRKILQKLADEEKTYRESGQKYTYLDICRGWKMVLQSFIIQLLWAILAFVYYGIAFGIGNIGGNLYVNMFVLGFIDIPAYLIVYVMSNRIGRRWTSFTFFLTATLAAFGVVIVSRTAAANGGVSTALAIICRFCVSAAWASFQVTSGEAYPTTIRNLGYGAAATTARIGGIVSPYAFAMGGEDLLIPFSIVGVMMLVCTVCGMLVRETRGIPLEDTLSAPGEPVKKQSNDSANTSKTTEKDYSEFTRF